MDNHELAKVLRERVEAQHHAALAALDVLVPYLTENNGVALLAAREKPLTNRAIRTPRGTATGSVTSALPSDRWVDVQYLAERTALPESKIRAVLYAKNRDQLGIEGRKVGGKAEFRRIPQETK